METVSPMSFVEYTVSLPTVHAWPSLDLCLRNASVAAFQLLYLLVRKASSAFFEVILISLTALT